MSSELQALREEVPLPEGWALGEVLERSLQRGPYVLQLAGLVAHQGDRLATHGSAACLEGRAMERAYFELLERISILEQPSTPVQGSWALSKSNGVALGGSHARATQAALYELVERDRLLRSWRGETLPQRLDWVASGVFRELESEYAFEAYAFSSLSEEAVTVGIFGWPRREGRCRIYGTAARGHLAAALHAAERECLQGYGFLSEEQALLEEPSFSPTPDYHQAYYLYPPNTQHLTDWLAGKRYHGSERKRSDWQVHFREITPQSLKGHVVVAQAVCTEAVSLYFGRRPEEPTGPVHPFS
ncbi:YcaO-like family protein [bacterium]|nr:YcaO-like family protein [bacterium]